MRKRTIKKSDVQGEGSPGTIFWMAGPNIKLHGEWESFTQESINVRPSDETT